MATPNPDAEPRRFSVEARWTDLDALPVLLVNQVVGQVLRGEITLTLGHVSPPALVGTDEQKRAQMDAIDVLPIRPVGRFTMTIGSLREIKHTLEETIAIYEREQALMEQLERAPHEEGKSS